MQNKRADLNFFPGWTRKSVTFTMDDGNLKYDEIFLDIVRQYGIKGTFNLCYAPPTKLSAEEFRAFYDGYEIANHCKYHPIVFDDGMPYTVSDDPFDPMTSRSYTADDPVVYNFEMPGLYKIHKYPDVEKTGGWYTVADEDCYCRLIDETRAHLESVFGEGRVRGYVWPSCEQRNSKVKAHIKERGYYGVRKTGLLGDKTGYALPADRMAWTYNANHDTLLTEAEKYENVSDTDELKFFCFGLHPADFERSKKWDDLLAFAKKYGNRPEEYYYASVGEIFDYQDARNSLVVTETKICNPSELTVYLKIDGGRLTIAPHCEIEI